MDIRNYILILFVFLVFHKRGSSCDCIPTSYKFIDNIDQRQLIIHAKVIKQTRYNRNEFRFDHFEGVTELQIIHSFKGKLWVDTLVHLNYSSAMCGSSIQYLDPDQEVFIKAQLDKEFNTVKEYFPHLEPGKELPNLNESDTLINRICQNHPNILSFGCDVAIVPVVDGFAQGRITRKQNKYWKRYTLLSKIKSEWAEKYFEKNILNENTDERKTLKQMYRIIKRAIGNHF